MTERPDVQPGDRFIDAAGYAAAVHREQSRKGTRVPYLAHLLGVASLVLEDGGDEDEAIAGLLHDAVEDGDADMVSMLDDIRARFGGRVATWSMRAPTWRWRAHRTGPRRPGARAILTDLAEEGSRLWGRFNAGRDDQLWYHESLALAAESSHGDSRLARELVRTAALLRQADV